MIRKLICVNSVGVIVLAGLLFVYPPVRAVFDIHDPVKTDGTVPAYVYVVLISTFLFGTWRILAAIYNFREAQRGPEPEVWTPKLQLSAWVVLVLGTTVSFGLGHGLIGMAMLVIAVMLPVTKRKRAPRGAEDWPEPKPAAAAAQTTQSGTPKTYEP